MTWEQEDTGWILERCGKATNGLAMFLEFLATFIFLMAFLLDVLNVSLKKILKTSITQTPEIAGFSVLLVAFLTMAAGFVRGEHIGFRGMDRFLPDRAAGMLRWFPLILTVVTLVFLTYLGFSQTRSFYQIGISAISMDFPLWIVLLSIPLGSAVSLLVVLVRAGQGEGL